jgi:hypothetical protein
MGQVKLPVEICAIANFWLGFISENRPRFFPARALIYPVIGIWQMIGAHKSGGTGKRVVSRAHGNQSAQGQGSQHGQKEPHDILATTAMSQ